MARAVFIALAGVVGAALILWTRAERLRRDETGFVAFSPTVRGCAVIVPAAPSEAELRAATLISETLAQAAGRPAFPVVRESRAGAGHGIFVGETRSGAEVAVPRVRRQAPFDDVFSANIGRGSAMLRSVRREAIEVAAGWFLEKHLGAHWFMPGPLGTHVPARTELRLAPSEERVRPAILSRSLGVDSAWGARNKLEARLEHGHSYARIFTRKDLLENPQLAPMRAGARFVPAADGMQGWQPDLTSPAVAAHAANYINRAFATEPLRPSFPLCQNDSVRYDDSPATIARVSPLRYFRGQPDYTPLVFRFTNEVADLVRATHPDKWVTAYAYDWTENAPDFRIAPNVVPFLTADRSQWFEPEFAAEDRALMARWVQAGPRIVGSYDYFEGAPYLVPRPTLYAVAAIPEIFAAGVRAFYGEGSPNWGLDGPKAWLAAQLQWDPRRAPAELLDTYYREFWQEAALPMRTFYSCAERAWLEQPRPGYWIKYYQDEHHTQLFPLERRREMRGCLADAARVATSEIVRARVALVRDAFAVSDAFAAFCEARDALTGAVVGAATPEGRLMELLAHCTRSRAQFQKLHADLRRTQPLAIQTDNLDLYLRNDPTGAAQRRLSQSAAGRRLLTEANLPPVELSSGAELLDDPPWQTVTIGNTGGSASFEWAGQPAVGVWRGHGDPFQTRSVTWGAEVGGGRALRFAGCKQEVLSQIRDGAVAGRTYVGTTRVRAKVSPGNSTFLILTFFDEKFQAFGIGHTCRLPVGEQREWAEIAVVQKAPPKARYVGLGVRVLNQVNDDFAEFAGVSLRAATDGR